MAEVSLAPPNATPFERAHSETDAARWPLPTHLIQDVWNPATCPIELLPYLAAGLGLEIWHDDWTEAYKRTVVANIWALKRNKTKLKGLQGYANLEAATIVAAHRPRDKMWWSGGMTADQRAALMANMPAIRIPIYAASATASLAKRFWGGRTIKQYWRVNTAWVASDAAQLYEQRATYVDQGVATRVTAIGLDSPLGAYTKIAITAPALPQKMFWGAKRFWGSGTAFASSNAFDNVLALIPDPSAASFALPTGIVPTSVRPQFVAEIVPARPGMRFWGSSGKAGLAWGGHSGVWRASDAELHVYNEVKLFVPSRLGLTRQPFSFWGWSRWGRPAYTAQLRVQVNLTRPSRQFGYGMPWGRSFWRKSDMSPLWNALAALDKARAFRDTVWIDTELYTPIQFSSGLRFGESDFKNFGDVRKLL